MAHKARHAFGSEANVDAALQEGKIDAFDILFLKEKKIGWIDADGNKVILDNTEQVSVVTQLPEAGKEGVLYIVVDASNPESVSASGSVWSGEKYVPVFSNSVVGGGVSEEVVDNKITEAMSIIEF